MRALAYLLLALPLTGCDKLTGAAEQKIADAEAIGFACRVAQKQPEDCMKENEAQSPSSILDGWKNADEEIRQGKLDPKMGIPAAHMKDSATEGDAKKDEKADEKPEAKTDAKKDSHPEAGKDGKPSPDGKEKDKAHG